MYRLSPEAHEAYRWIRERLQEVTAFGQKMNIAAALRNQLRHRGGGPMSDTAAARSIKELTKAGLLIPLTGYAKKRWLLKFKGGWATRSQRIHQVIVVPDEAIRVEVSRKIPPKKPSRK